MIPKNTQYRNISKSRHHALRLIREEAIVKFFKRFSGQKLKGSHRKQTRQVERWLDKTGANIAFDKEKMSFVVYNTEMVSCLVVRVQENEEKNRYEYDYSIEEIPDLKPEFAFTSPDHKI